MEDTIKYGVAAATQHEGIDYWRVLYSNAPWAAEPTQCVNYTSAHDNLTLWDKLSLTGPWESRDDLIKMNLLSAAIILTCQGIPFFQAGEEFLRSKPLN
jgi:pullulanase